MKEQSIISLETGCLAAKDTGGEPFPVIHMDDGSIKLVPEDELPLTLPEVDNFKTFGYWRIAVGKRE